MKKLYLGIIILLISMVSSSGAIGQPMMPPPPQTYYPNYPTFEGYWNGSQVYLQNVPNVTVEQLPDATLVGTLNDFTAIEPPYSNPPFYCLNGENINVWEAPNEFPGELVVHNGDEGSQCTYGTWIMAQEGVSNVVPAPAPVPELVFSYSEGVNVYYAPAFQAYIYGYNGYYYKWVSGGWLYASAYSGPWFSVSAGIYLPALLVYGPPPPLVAYEPYFAWWRYNAAPWYRVYHPGWWHRYGHYVVNYNIYKTRIINRYYINHYTFNRMVGAVHPTPIFRYRQRERQRILRKRIKIFKDRHPGLHINPNRFKPVSRPPMFVRPPVRRPYRQPVHGVAPFRPVSPRRMPPPPILREGVHQPHRIIIPPANFRPAPPPNGMIPHRPRHNHQLVHRLVPFRPAPPQPRRVIPFRPPYHPVVNNRQRPPAKFGRPVKSVHPPAKNKKRKNNH